MTGPESFAEVTESAVTSPKWQHELPLRPLSLLGDADAGADACADGICRP